MKRVVVFVMAVVAVVLAATQLAGVALFGSLGEVPSFAHAVASSWPFTAAHTTGLDRVTPFRITLARAALVRGEPDRAGALLAGLPSRAEVSDLRGQVALAHGTSDDAVANFGVAGDVVRARAAIDAVAARDPVAAFDLAAAFAHDAQRRNAPTPVRGDASWRAGQLAVGAGVVRPAEAHRYDITARDFFRDAVRDDPTQEAYLLALGMAALNLGDGSESRDVYRRAVDVVRDSVDAYVGVAVSEAQLGDCPASRAALAQARAYAQRQGRTFDVASAGYNAPALAPFARCTASAR